MLATALLAFFAGFSTGTTRTGDGDLSIARAVGLRLAILRSDGGGGGGRPAGGRSSFGVSEEFASGMGLKAMAENDERISGKLHHDCSHHLLVFVLRITTGF